MKPPVKFKWRGIHHGYLGAFFVGFGLFFLYMNANNELDLLNLVYCIFAIVGGYLIIDDLIEHVITESTPARIIWNWIARGK